MAYENKMTPSTLESIRLIKGNDQCIDCSHPHPDWASVTFGTLFCIDCSGKHRSLGVHIDFVRSLVMDSWESKQVLQMIHGGNDAYKEFLKLNGLAHLFGSSSTIVTREEIIARYDSSVAREYKESLKKRALGLSGNSIVSEELTVEKESTASKPNRVIAGFGSDPTYDPKTGRFIDQSSGSDLLTNGGIVGATVAVVAVVGYAIFKHYA